MSLTTTAAADRLEHLAAELCQVAQDLRANPESLSSNNGKRLELLKTIKSAQEALMQPQDFLFQTIPMLAELAATRLFSEWNVFRLIPTQGTITYEDIAAELKADVALITRLAWVLVSNGVLKQVGKNQVAHTPRSVIYTSLNPLSAIFATGFDDHIESFSAMPKYFREFGLKEPIGRYKTIFTYSKGLPDSTVWEVMNRTPESAKIFAMAMAAGESIWPTLGSYDLSWVVDRANEATERPLVVDVGGGKGHCLKAMAESTPGLALNRCVLQDLPDVLDAVEQSNDTALQGVRLVPLDFHKEQPTKGALVYYIRRCLHDYGDEDCIEMLRHIADAMTADSRLLIVEQVMNNPPSPMSAAADLIMATIGGKERTLDNFELIVVKAGLRIQGVFRSPGTDASIVECSKA